jgi:hypothetical protein
MRGGALLFTAYGRAFAAIAVGFVVRRDVTWADDTHFGILDATDDQRVRKQDHLGVGHSRVRTGRLADHERT